MSFRSRSDELLWRVLDKLGLNDGEGSLYETIERRVLGKLADLQGQAKNLVDYSVPHATEPGKYVIAKVDKELGPHLWALLEKAKKLDAIEAYKPEEPKWFTKKLNEMRAKAAKWDALQLAEAAKEVHGPLKLQADRDVPPGVIVISNPSRSIGRSFSPSDPVPTLNAPLAWEAKYVNDAHDEHMRAHMELAESVGKGLVKMQERGGIDANGNLVFRMTPPQPENVEHKFEIKVEYGEGLIAKSIRTKETGPGLAARYPDATKPDTKRDEPITCDLSGDWD